MPVIKSKLQENPVETRCKPGGNPVTNFAGQSLMARASSIAQAGAEASKSGLKSAKSQGDALYSGAIYPLRYATLNRKLSICAWSGFWL
jgi:hypothetical protein